MFSLPKLKYEYKALEPYISEEIMITHHQKHQQTYVDTLNEIVKNNNLTGKSLKDLLYSNQGTTVVDKQLRDYGGGHFNHSFFWVCMTPEQKEISQVIKQAINESFGSVCKFKEEFNSKAAKLFGSGWVWLVQKEKLYIETSINQDNPMMKDGSVLPLLCLDVWEHAYYLQYKNKRKEYIERWWNIVDWDFVETIYKKARVDICDDGSVLY